MDKCLPVYIVLLFLFLHPNELIAHCTLTHPGHCVEDVGKAAETVVRETGKAAETVVRKTGKAAETTVRDLGKGAEELVNNTGKNLENAIHDLGDGVENTGTQLGNALEHIDRWVRTGNCGGDICDTLGKAIKDTHAEGKRTVENLEDAADATAKFVERQINGLDNSLSDAEKRLREGKVVDALWQFATDSIENTDENAAKLAQESKYIRAVGQVAAGAYGGPGGSAAYAAWLTYKQTGDADLAIKAGMITGATSLANGTITQMPSDELATKAITAGAIGGAAVAASGGDNQAVLEGFLMAGGMVVVQDGYKKITGHKLDEDSLKHSEGPAYCLKVTAAAFSAEPGHECIPREDIFKRGERGEILYADTDKTIPLYKDKSRLMADLDPRRPHVGLMAEPGEAGVFQETGKLLRKASKIPGMNAMAVFHDQWAINWDMNAVTTAATIPPAIVLTYIGTGGPSYDLIRKSNIETSTQKQGHRSQADHDHGPRDFNQSANKNNSHLLHQRAEVSRVKEAKNQRSKSDIHPSFICSKGNLVRQIAVEYPAAGSEEVCRVLYASEKGFQVPWHAKNDEGYCLPRAEAFVAKQIMDFGWQCVGQ